MTSKDPLLQPFQLRHLTLKNRIMSTSHTMLYAVDGAPQQRYQLYHEEKARGGVSLTMFGGSSAVTADSATATGVINLTRDSVMPSRAGTSIAPFWIRDACVRICESVASRRVPVCNG